MYQLFFPVALATVDANAAAERGLLDMWDGGAERDVNGNGTDGFVRFWFQSIALQRTRFHSAVFEQCRTPVYHTVGRKFRSVQKLLKVEIPLKHQF